MKILHTADLHLGAPLRTLLPPAEATLRREELLSAFSYLLKIAEEEHCAAVLIAGDLFDTEHASRMLSPSVLAAIEKHADIDFYYVPGNHEGQAKIHGTQPKNLHIFGDSFSYFKKENITFFGKSNIKRSDFDNICLQSNRINILIAHGTWNDGYAEKTDLSLGHLSGRFIDYCALGHFHTYQARRIDARGIAVYSGCPEGRGFDEIGPKGAVLIDTDGGKIAHRFLPLSRRTLHRIEVDISLAKNLFDVFDAVENAVLAIPPQDLLRLVLKGERGTLAPIHTETLQRHLHGRFYYIEAEDRSFVSPCPEKYRSENSLRGEFVRAVEADASLCDEERMRILDLGLSALAKNQGGREWS